VTPEALRAELAKGRVRPAYLLAGSEGLLRDEALALLREAVLGESPAEFNLDRFDAAGCTPAALRSAVQMLPVLGARRLVWLREPEAGRAGSKGLTEVLAEIVPKLPETAVLVVTASKVDRRSRWVKAFAEPAVLVECEAPQGGAALAAFVAAEAARCGLSLEPGVAELLAERVGPELLVLRQELEKAALLAVPATRIARAHVEAGVVALAEKPVWDLTDAIGEGRALVVLGSCADRATTYSEFKAYAPFVPVGSYVVVTDTIVNGHPVWPAFGPGPAEAVKQVLTGHGEFVADPLMEKYSLTFNPGGFLRRVR